MQAGAERAWKALGWIAAAVVLAAVAGVVYLRPTVGSPAPAAASAAPAPDLGDVALAGVAFADASHGMVSVVWSPLRQGAPRGTYITADGGRSWRAAPDTVTYLADGRGVIQWQAGRATEARFTTDGGRTWRQLQLPEPTNGQQPTFLDARRGWMLVFHAPGPGGQAVALWRTDDGGATWQPLAGAGIPVAGAKSGLTFVDADHGVMVDGSPGGTQTILATEDGGASWRPAATLTSPLPGARPLGVAIGRRGPRLVAWLATLAADQFNQQGGIFVVGSNPRFDEQGYVLTSDDAGRTWSAPRAGPHLDAGFLGQPVVDARGRLLLIESRRLWVSEDDGATWIARLAQAPEGVDPAIILPSPAGALFAAGGRAASGTTDTRFLDTLLRSTDGGVHWVEVALPRAR